MHRRMSLGFALMLLVVCLVGAAPASAEPLSAAKAPVIGSFDLLDWAWEWLTSLVSEGSTGGRPGDESGVLSIEGGPFMDPNGGNS